MSSNYGSLLIGGLASATFSGMLAVQCILYSKTFISDPIYVKSIVAVVWSLDVIHSALIWTGLWHWFVSGFGLDHIPSAMSISVLFTAVTTFIAHCVFGWRILQLSKRNWWICGPIFSTAILRVVSAAACSGEMIRIGSFILFKLQFKWLFSLGLALSSVVDVLIAAAMIITLKKRKQSSMTLNSILDSLIIYSFENGFMTSVATVASLICWLAMDNFVFLGLYFVVAKFYANSVLAIFNRRARLRLAHEGSNERHQSGLAQVHGQGFDHNGVIELLVLSRPSDTTKDNIRSAKDLDHDDSNLQPTFDISCSDSASSVPAPHKEQGSGSCSIPNSIELSQRENCEGDLAQGKFGDGKKFGMNTPISHHGGIMKSITIHVRKD